MEICKKYGYNCGTLTELEIPKDTYNDTYTIHPTYNRSEEGPPFEMEQNEVHLHN